MYGGYFGAGNGILMLAAMGVLGLNELHRANGIKNFLGICINAVAVLIFAIAGYVVWEDALLMACGALVGGYFGANMAMRVGPEMGAPRDCADRMGNIFRDDLESAPTASMTPVKHKLRASFIFDLTCSLFLVICSASCWLCPDLMANASRGRSWKSKLIVVLKTGHHMLMVDAARNEPRRCTEPAALLTSTLFTACITSSTSSAVWQMFHMRFSCGHSSPSKGLK